MEIGDHSVAISPVAKCVADDSYGRRRMERLHIGRTAGLKAEEAMPLSLQK
jgi:hypothetical protein